MKNGLDDCSIQYFGCTLRTYINRYAGYSKIDRLFFIIDHIDLLRLEALNFCIELCIKFNYVEAYEKLYQLYSSEISLAIDLEWIQKTKLKIKEALFQSESALQCALETKNNEVIQNALINHANFYFSQGKYQSALKYYLRAGEFLYSLQDQIHINLSIIQSSYLNRNYTDIPIYIKSIKKQMSENENPSVDTRLNVMRGLLAIQSNDFREAVKLFLKCNTSPDTDFNEIISSPDLAIYIGILSLVSFNREELKTYVLHHKSFLLFSNTIPQVLELLKDFINCKYATFYSKLSIIKQYADSDQCLHKYTSDLFHKIVCVSIKQYIYPYSSVDLVIMAHIMDMNLEEIEVIIEKLILTNQIFGKLNPQSHCLDIFDIASNPSSLDDFLHTGEQFCFELSLALLQYSLKLRNVSFATLKAYSNDESIHQCNLFIENKKMITNKANKRSKDTYI